MTIKKTDPNNINFADPDEFKLIDWDNIDFLVGYMNDEQTEFIIHRRDSVPQIGGFKTIIAYKENLRRLLCKLQNPLRGAEVWKVLDGNQLFDISYQLARGSKIKFPLQDVKKSPL